LQILKNRAFTLIEILIVIFIIALLAFIAWPKLSDWISDRQVRGEVYRLVQYIEGKKEDAIYGKYAMSWIWISGKSTGKSEAWTMSDEEWALQMKVPAPARTAQYRLSSYNNKSILNHHRACGSSAKGYNNEGTQYYTKDSNTFSWSSKVTSSNKHLCIDKDGLIVTDGENQNGIEGKVWMIVCSTANTGPDYSKLCYWNRDKINHRYIIKVDLGTKIKVYKYNINNDKWILQRL